MSRPIAPTGANNSEGGSTSDTKSVLGESMSVIDETAELTDLPADSVEALANTAPTADLINTEPTATAGPSVEELQQQIMEMQDDVNTLNVIRNDPGAATMLNDHFERKLNGSGLPETTGDANADPAPGNDPRMDQLFGAVEKLTTMVMEDRAKNAFDQFATQHPDARDPNMVSKLREIFKTPGSENLSLERAYVVAKSELGIGDSDQLRTQLKPTEVSGSPTSKVVDRSSALQADIDGQDTLEAALKVAITGTAREQGLNF